ncbi:MAG: hypothetical protein Q7K34_01035 [archaeon]|nr:hypothetical protein [archaeon]
MDSKKLFVIFIAVVMVGSIFAVFLYGGNLNNSPQPPPAPPVDGSQTTAVDFEAAGVAAKVVRLFPTIVVTLPTTETDKTVLDSRLAGVQGIAGLLSSRFSQAGDPTGSGGLSLIYVAELSVSSDESTLDLADRVSAVEGFEKAEVIRAGFVSLPTQVTFSNQLGLTQGHVFESPFSNAYLSAETLAEDEVEVFLQASLAADSLQSIIAIEEKNISASPKQASVAEPLPIDSLEPQLAASFVGSEEILAVGATAALEEELLALFPDSNSAIVSLGFFSPALEITLDKNYSSFQEDFKTVLTDFNGVIDFDLSLDENKLLVFLGQETFLETKQKIFDEFASLNFGVLGSKGPAVPMEAAIDFQTTVLSENALKLSGFLSSKPFSGANVFQPASFSAVSFTEPDSNSVYSLEKGSFSGLVFPTHAVGETVNLSINFVATRGKIISINAKEN